MLTKLSLLAATAIIAVAFVSTDPGIEKIIAQLEIFKNDYPQEKVHLHLDRPFYSVGDTIYFKAYLVNAENNYPEETSKLLYVDLASERGDIISTILLPMEDGITWGNLQLDDSLQEGNYHLRAYTNWMRNFDEAFYFDEVISIGNALSSDIKMDVAFAFDTLGSKVNGASILYTSLKDKSRQAGEVSYKILLQNKEVSKGSGSTNAAGKMDIDITALQKGVAYTLQTTIKTGKRSIATKSTSFTLPTSSHSVQFFPEGGAMISGISCRIGFKVLNANGPGSDLTGEVKDEKGNTVINFKADFAGMGSFIFTPLHGHTYHAGIHYPGGAKEDINLPPASESGYAIFADNLYPRMGC